MDILRGILDRIVLIGAILTAGCVPSFIGQYQQRLGGMLDQANRDLALFQDIANRFHGGDIQRLIKHHLASTDATFRAEGTAIQAMVETVARLKANLAALNTDLFNQVRWIAQEGDGTVARATWDTFVPAMSFTPEALLFAFGTGVSIWLVFLAVWFGAARFMDLIFARGRPGEWVVPKKRKREA
jgi:hypothetical protein